VIRIGIDTGGTFTDFVVFEGGRLRVHKELSTPAAPEEAIVRGLDALGVRGLPGRIVHGSTVATNALLERKGARTVFVTNRGMRDLLSIGRQARRELYKLQPTVEPPPVPRGLCLETGGRLGSDGAVVEPLAPSDLDELRARIAALAPQAVAVNLLFSYLDGRFERAIRDALPPELFVSLSSEVLPEFREYERGITTWLNAYVGPLMQGYLQNLNQALGSRPSLCVMQSSGLTCDVEFAGRRAVNLLLSGPAGGLRGAQAVAHGAGRHRILSFDMGGTSTDVALVDGELQLTGAGVIGGYPVAVPMVDVHSIGAGGGSVAMVDAGGLLRVGPESAGADPGPACYGRGGKRPTVTDAQVVLGRLPAGVRLAGSLALDADAAHSSYARLGEQLGGLSAQEAALGVVRLINEHMYTALRVISVERGHDPRGFTLVSLGGAAGLHVCELAERLGVRTALVPLHAGVLSAFGMLAAPPGRQLSHSVRSLIGSLTDGAVEATLAALAQRARQELVAEGAGAVDLELRPSVDLCYRGQGLALNLAWRTLARAAADFHAVHERRYGHRLDMPVELVNVRLGVRAPHEIPQLAQMAPGAAGGHTTPVYGISSPVPVKPRASLAGQAALEGPAIIVDDHATTWVAPGWSAQLDAWGNVTLGCRAAQQR
jgi:N-methylhydantoinase A